MTVLIVAGPVIIGAAAVGLIIGILQAATQIQDQTIPSTVKLIGVMVLLIVIGFWMFSYLTRFTEKTIGKAFSMVMQNRNTLNESEDITSKEGQNSSPGESSSAMNSQGSSSIPLPLNGFNNALSNSPLGNSSLGASGQLSGNSGSFNATIAPPMQAFSNAMQTQLPPSNQENNNLNNYSYIPPSRLEAPISNKVANPYSYNSRPDYGSSYNPGYNQSLPNEPYAYSSPASNQSYYNPASNYKNNGLPPEMMNSTLNLQGTNSAPKDSSSASNKVVLKPATKTVAKKNKVMAAAPEPVKIFRPKLPGSESEASEESQGDSLPATSNAETKTESGSTWW
jgi:type III secretory pathway component EscS